MMARRRDARHAKTNRPQIKVNRPFHTHAGARKGLT